MADRYVHDCDRCRFVTRGHVDGMSVPVDWYLCGSSVIGRYDDAGHAYWSSPAAMVPQIAAHGDAWGEAALVILGQ